ncbi:MAG: hypothetical protein HYW49_06200 [Deltaproteobacteria bacterium]|nr:hypothetical protein [Deltaproteobacteria bacterium]
MSKQGGDQKPEMKKPGEFTSRPADHKPHFESPSKGGNVGGKVGCAAWGCKSEPKRYSFCDEHFNQYKFGLIKKTGEPVSDYEKKFEHYQKWLRAQKVA